MSEREEKENKIKKEIQDQICNLIDVNISEICTAAESFENEDENFSVSMKSKLKYNGFEAKIESEITIPGLRTKDSTDMVVLSLKESDLL